MLKRINWKAVFKGFAWIFCLAGVVVLMSFIEVKKKTVKCKEIEILIPGADNFIEIEEIDAILKQGQGELIGRNLKNINLHNIEKSIAANPYIGFVKVYADMNGTVSIEVKQRQPVLRILNAGGQDYYVDRDGLKMPISPNFTADVLVATGYILEGFNGRVDTLMTVLAKDLYKTALYLKQDSLWDAQIEQLFINEKNDIEMIPRVGNQRIILGDAQNVAVKMNNLLAFYQQAMPKAGWNAYSTINLKYINQVVCEKRDSLAIKKISKPLFLDSAIQQKQAVDSAVKASIQSEIKKALATAEKPKEAKPVASKETEKVKATTSEDKSKVVPVKTEQKPVVTKETDKVKAAISADKNKVAPVKAGQKPTTTTKEKKNR